MKQLINMERKNIIYYICEFSLSQSFGPFSSLESVTTFIKDNNLKYAKIYELL